MVRQVVLRGDGFALAESLDGDQEWLSSTGDGAFDVDQDDRPKPFDAPVTRLVVTTEDGSELLGGVSWHPVVYGRSAGCVALNLGCTLLPSARNKGIGAALTRVLAKHLFDTSEVFRVEASTDVANEPAQRTLERAGFTREGVIRSAQLRGGELHDLVGYSILRSDL